MISISDKTAAQSSDDIMTAGGKTYSLKLLKQEIQEYGFTIIEGLIPTPTVDRMAERLLEILQNESGRNNLYQNRQGLLNYDPIFVHLVDQPIHHALAHWFLGDGFCLGETGTVLARPGCKAQGIHADTPYGSWPDPLPDCRMMLNSIYMLTDFTADNGATRVWPFTHRMRTRPEVGFPYRYGVPAIAPRGSAVIFDGVLWHGSGDNITSDQLRLGVSVVYHHFMINADCCGWDRIRPDVYEQLPEHIRQLLRLRVL